MSLAEPPRLVAPSASGVGALPVLRAPHPRPKRPHPALVAAAASVLGGVTPAPPGERSRLSTAPRIGADASLPVPAPASGRHSQGLESRRVAVALALELVGVGAAIIRAAAGQSLAALERASRGAVCRRCSGGAFVRAPGRARASRRHLPVARGAARAPGSSLVRSEAGRTPDKGIGRPADASSDRSCAAESACACRALDCDTAPRDPSSTRSRRDRAGSRGTRTWACARRRPCVAPSEPRLARLSRSFPAEPGRFRWIPVDSGR